MRIGCIVALSLVASCAEWSPRAEPPRTVTVARVARDGQTRADATPTMFVWARDKNGATFTYQVQPDGTSTSRLEGIHLVVKGTEWTWLAKTVDVETAACDLSLGQRQAPQGGTVTRASLIDAGAREQVVVPATGFDCNGEGCVNELRHEVQPIASIGPYLFVEETHYSYACGAHGSTGRTFSVWDVEHARPVDVTNALPQPDVLRAEAEKRFADDEKENGGPMDESPPAVTEVLPVFDGHRVAFEAQLTISACYACSDGLWSSYTRSVRLRTPAPPVLASYRDLPAPVSLFASRHSELTVGGWSEVLP